MAVFVLSVGKPESLCSIACKSPGGPLLLPLPALPGRGGGSGGTTEHSSLQMHHRGLAAEASSAACFSVSTDLLLAFWPQHPVPVETSHSL